MIGEYCDRCENNNGSCEAYIACYRGIYELACGDEGIENLLDRIWDFDGVPPDEVMVFKAWDELSKQRERELRR